MRIFEELADINRDRLAPLIPGLAEAIAWPHRAPNGASLVSQSTGGHTTNALPCLQRSSTSPRSGAPAPPPCAQGRGHCRVARASVGVPVAATPPRVAPSKTPRVLTMSTRRWHRATAREAVVPYLRMCGRWLEEHGFQIGGNVHITVEQGRVVLTNDAPRWPKPRGILREALPLMRHRRLTAVAALGPSHTDRPAAPPRAPVSLVLATAANAGPHVLFVRVVGDCMEPVIGDGWLIRVDISRVEPQPGDVVAVHIEGAGNVIGYWGGGDRAALLHENPAHSALDLWPRCFRVVGTVTAVVDRPIAPAPTARFTFKCAAVTFTRPRLT